MYIFVLQWPPALKSALGAGVSVPFGTVFSCFMVCCMIGSTLFSALSRAGVPAEDTMAGMLSMATLAMLAAMTLDRGPADLRALFRGRGSGIVEVIPAEAPR